jgi:glycosyltransferase involved in cell wall biosynthesis
MKIAMMHNFLCWRGGAERQILKLAIELQNAGHEVEIFTVGASEECYPELLKKVTVNVIPNFWNRVSIPFSGKWGRRLVGLTENYSKALPSMFNLGRKIPDGFDLINNHNSPTEWAAFLAKKRLKVPVVWMCNEPPFWFFIPEHRRGRKKINWPLFELFDKVSVDYVDRIIVLSAIAANYVRIAYNRSATIVRSGVDVELLHNASGKKVRKKNGLEDDFILLQVGNIARNKRQNDSIRILHSLSKRYDNLKLILDGAGSTDELARLSEKLGVRDKVLFWHTCGDEELAGVYAACDVFLFPAEITWGLAVVEAMAASKPVIISRRCGAAEVVQNGSNGIVIEDNNLEEWVRQIELLIENPRLCKNLGENAFEYVRNNLSWEKYARDMANVFENEIGRFRNKVRQAC